MLRAKNPIEIVIINGEDKTKEVEKIEITSSFVRIKFLRNPKIYTYNADKIVIKNNYYEEEAAKSIMGYFAAEATCSPIKIEEHSGSILKDYIDMITQITDDMSLSYYVHKKNIEKKSFDINKLIYPFGINVSQKQAVENAFSFPLSIIQGPPGTGKTQTILNIIANAVLQKKSIAIVSNNNSAVLNVAEKLKKYDLDFLVAALGSRQNRDAFLLQKHEYPNLDSFKIQENRIILHYKISKNLGEIQEILEKQNELLSLKQIKDAILLEQKHFLQNYIDKENANQLEKMLLNFDSNKIFKIWAYCQNKSTHLTFFDYVFFFLNMGVSFLFLKDKRVFLYTDLIQKIFYERKIEELSADIKNMTNFLESKDLDKKLKQMVDDSIRLLKGFLYKKFHNKKHSNFSLHDTSNLSDDFVAEYPVILSTLFSLKNTCKNGFIFDYLVVDEASQADLLTSVIAMSCAKNIIIVGDIKQLPNVITKEVQENSELLLRSYHVDDAYKLYKHSLLSSILALYPDAPNVLLREHYRCHPKIIGFCNNKYYHNELILFTENKDEKDVLKAIKTRHGNHARGHINQRQIDIIKKEIIPYIEENLSIGIITPYRDQVNALRDNLPQNIEIDTIHKFQGREKDIIILSTVDNGITEFIDNPNLINVAVSRAVKKFWIVYSNENEKLNSNIVDLVNYIKYNNFEVVQSKVFSIFDLLYKRYTDERVKFLNKHPLVSEYASENIAYVCIKSCLSKIANSSLDVVYGVPLKNLIYIDKSLYTEEEVQFIYRNSHVDFLIYNKINKKTILAIEVDGSDHRNNLLQKHRDELKNSILAKADLALLRLPTTGSGEKDLIINSIMARLQKIENME